MAQDGGPLRERIDAIQPAACAEPQDAGRVLAHAGDVRRTRLLSVGRDTVRCERFTARVEAVEEAVAADPQCVRATSQQRIDVDAAETVLLARIVAEHS